MRLFLLVFYLIFNSFAYSDDATLFYQKGVEAKSIGERESNFEKALKIYMAQLMNLKEQNQNNGFLLYNIANCYFNLNRLGEAVLYYKEALKYIPKNEKVLRNYEIALAKRIDAVDVEKNSELVQTLLFFHYRFNLKTKYLILLILSSSFFLFYVLYRKKQIMYFKHMRNVVALLYVILLISVYIAIYHPTHEGVLIQESLVHQDRGDAYASLVEKPLGIGSVLIVVSLDKGWYKVRLNNGQYGYVKESFLNLIL